MDSLRPNPRNSLRLQKHLANCGFGSRRACERLIAEGAVTVDGKTVSEQGVKVSPESQIIAVRGVPAQPDPEVYLLLNKPCGYLCTSDDPKGRKTYQKLLPNLPARVYTVGRLDFDSEGLILVTNDGELCNRLIHPRHEIEKIYSVTVSRRLKNREQEILRRGMTLEGDRMRMENVRLARSNAKGHIYRITLKEGKNRQIRRMLNALGVKVLRLRRIQIGPIKLGNMKSGESRPLTPSEIRTLKSHRS